VWKSELKWKRKGQFGGPNNYTQAHQENNIIIIPCERAIRHVGRCERKVVPRTEQESRGEDPEWGTCIQHSVFHNTGDMESGT